jgi:plastocyanin
MLLLATGSAQAETPQDVSGAIYAIARDMAKMQAQIEELRTMVARLSDRNVCRETEKKVEAPPPRPVAAPALPPQAPPPSRGSVSGRVLFDGEMTAAYAYVADLVEAPAKKTAEIRQKGLKFRPEHLVVQTGTRISFPNDDKIHHHVFSVSPAGSFNLGYSRSDHPTPTQLFAAPGVVDINCDIHPLMKATVLVVPNRHWVPVHSDGTFTLIGVPLGRRTIRVWGPGAEIAEQQVTVTAEGSEPVSLKLEPAKRGKP